VSIELRPPVREDAAAIATALNEFNRPAESVLDSPEEVEVWLGFPSLDAEHDMRVAVIDGRIVGYGEACDISGEGRTVIGDVRADPAHPDASVALLGFVEKRAQERIRDGGKLRIWVPEKAEAQPCPPRVAGICFSPLLAADGPRTGRGAGAACLAGRDLGAHVRRREG
jgi:hypothetical protein